MKKIIKTIIMSGIWLSCCIALGERIEWESIRYTNTLTANSTISVTNDGRSVWGGNLSVSNISSLASGASQHGINTLGGLITIGIDAYGAMQRGMVTDGNMIISRDAVGSGQYGLSGTGSMIISNGTTGAEQRGENIGRMVIGSTAHGASQSGRTMALTAATNNGIGAIQIFDLSSSQNALTTDEGDASLLLGAGIVSNKNSIVAGDGQISHGDGSITAGGGFWSGSNGIYSNANGWVCNTNLNPSVSNAFDLGTALVPWRDIYLGSNSIYMGGLKAFSLSNGVMIVGTTSAVINGGSIWYNRSNVADYLYSNSATEVIITGYVGSAGDIIIPDMIDGLPVTTIGDNVFAFNSSLNSVSGGNNVRTIAYGAFQGATLVSVSLPEVTTIGESAFTGCYSLTNIDFPKLESIGPTAFWQNGALTSVSFPRITSIGDRAFEFCSAITALVFDVNAPPEGSYGTVANFTNYVINPTATGWGTTWYGRPVVRMPVYADSLTLGGSSLSNWPTGLSYYAVTPSNIAIGVNANASYGAWPNYGIALGSNSSAGMGIAIGNQSTGLYATAVGNFSFAYSEAATFGEYSYADSFCATFGDRATSLGNSAAFGRRSYANDHAEAFGEFAYGNYYSFGGGRNSRAHNFSVSLGESAIASNFTVSAGDYAGYGCGGTSNLFLGSKAGQNAGNFTNASAIGPGAMPLGNFTMSFGNTEIKTNRFYGIVQSMGGFYSGECGIYTNVSGWVCNTNLNPSASNVYTLGTLLNPWKHVYVGDGTIYIGSNTLSVSNNQLITSAPIVQQNGTNTPVSYALANATSFTNYIITFATSNDISLANGNLQYFAPTNTSTIYMPNPTNSFTYSLTLIVNPSTNLFSISSINMVTNGSGSVGSLVITNSGPTTLLFWKEYLSDNWKGFSL